MRQAAGLCPETPPGGSASWRVPGQSPGAVALLLSLLIFALPAFAMLPPDRTAALQHGINITGWFRFPPSRDPTVLGRWLSDAAMADLKRAGFTFVRLAVDPAVIDGPAMRRVLVDQVRRLQRHGLAVIVSPHPVSWNLDANPADRDRLATFWRDLAPALRSLAPALTFPEVLNEPVFHEDPATWWSLQNDLHATIRAALPGDTIILTGQDWGSIAGLLALTPDPEDPNADANVVYSFHFYDPAELTSLAAYRPGLDRDALAQLPFPAADPVACQQTARSARDAPTRDLMAFYCTTGWDTARIRARLQDAVSWARRYHAALLAGEFGASAALNPAARFAWLRLVRETCASNGIFWALWGYDDVMGFGVRRPPENRPQLDRSVLAALGLRVP
jgi:endoglucanase